VLHWGVSIAAKEGNVSVDIADLPDKRVLGLQFEDL
jgi:hypothetical protein